MRRTVNQLQSSFNKSSTAQPANENPESELIGGASFLGHFIKQLECVVESTGFAEGVDDEVEGVGVRGDTCGNHVGVEPRGEVGAVVMERGAEEEVVERGRRRG